MLLRALRSSCRKARALRHQSTELPFLGDAKGTRATVKNAATAAKFFTAASNQYAGQNSVHIMRS